MEATLLSSDLNRRYEQQWDKVRSLVELPLEGRYIQTALGPVWLLEAGPADAPPLLALHGLHTPAPFNLELFSSLTQHFRVISPDIPGQAGKTPGLAPVPTGHAYAAWLQLVMDALGIECCPMVGLSFGGSVALDLAALNPSRISSLSMVVPAGFFRPLWRPLKKLLFPLLSFKVHSDFPHFGQLMSPVMGDNWPELEAYYYSVLQAGIPMTMLPPGPFSADDLRRFSAPVQLIVAEEDVYFAPDKLIKKARQNVPNLAEVVRIDDLHVPNQRNRNLIQSRVTEFLLNH